MKSTALSLVCLGLCLGGCGRPQETAADGERVVAIDSAAQFEREVLQASLPCVVDFYADWCGPCRRLSPVLAELAAAWEGRVKVVKVNVDQHRDLAVRYGVSGIPDVRYFLGGELVGGAVGFRQASFWQGEFARLAAAGAAGASASEAAQASGERP